VLFRVALDGGACLSTQDGVMEHANPKETRMNPLKHLRRNLIAYVALFCALTAGAYAAGLKKNSVGSKQIKSGAVKTDEIADGAVTGAKIAKGTLGQVPNAAQADSAASAQNAENAQTAQNAVNAQNAQNATTAQNATNAQHAATADNATNAQHAQSADDAGTVGGMTVKSFSVARDLGSGDQPVVTVGDLTLSVDCDGGGDNEVRARTGADNANLQSVAFYADASTTKVAANENDFDTGEVVAVVPHAVDAGNLTGHLVYKTAANSVVTVDFATDAVSGQCEFAGTAVGS
jgi:hypothetical protein